MDRLTLDFVTGEGGSIRFRLAELRAGEVVWPRTSRTGFVAVSVERIG